LKGFQAYRRDPELSKYQGWEPTSDDEALSFLADQSVQELGPEGQWLQIAVTCSDTRRLIGDFGLCVRDSKLGIVTMGFTISRPFHRNGYATEAARGILSVLFETNEIQEVACETDARNEAAIRLLRRLGFVLAKTDVTKFRGEPCVEHTYAMSSIQWRTQQAR
jgi:aminoglycoside 6'-N-acetyltransferase